MRERFCLVTGSGVGRAMKGGDIVSSVDDTVDNDIDALLALTRYEAYSNYYNDRGFH